ncbi:MAG: lipoprotein-releasing system ATP-binding protein LolD 1 [Phycisphaerae bacterium]|nr:MAG: lipoprotein-releasing system ATP-binding protein LolD 1 [Phycisphaerae bacterium]
MLELNAICKQHETRGEPLVILNDLSLRVERGESVSIVGPSGSGKSTLLNIVGTLDTPTGGEFTIDGVSPLAASKKELARYRNQQIGFVFQEHHLLPQLSALENVVLPSLAFSESTGTNERALVLLERVGLANRTDHLPAELSGGERQRVAIARALIHRPKLLLADEPTGNLDRKSADAVADLLFELQRADSCTLLMVTHSPTLAQRCERCFELTDGKLMHFAETTAKT